MEDRSEAALSGVWSWSTRAGWTANNDWWKVSEGRPAIAIRLLIHVSTVLEDLVFAAHAVLPEYACWIGTGASSCTLSGSQLLEKVVEEWMNECLLEVTWSKIELGKEVEQSVKALEHDIEMCGEMEIPDLTK